jgi:hypothetical protein
VFTFIPDHSSESSRIGVQHHPGIAFMFPRNPQFVGIELDAAFCQRAQRRLTGDA